MNNPPALHLNSKWNIIWNMQKMRNPQLCWIIYNCVANLKFLQTKLIKWLNSFEEIFIQCLDTCRDEKKHGYSVEIRIRNFVRYSFNITSPIWYGSSYENFRNWIMSQPIIWLNELHQIQLLELDQTPSILLLARRFSWKIANGPQIYLSQINAGKNVNDHISVIEYFKILLPLG